MPSSPTKGAKGGKKRQFRLARAKNTKKKALTFVLSSLLFTATVLEGLFGEYHSSSAALGQQRPEVTKQPLLVIGWQLPKRRVMLIVASLEVQRKSSTDEEWYSSSTGDWTALPLFTSFSGPDGTLYPYIRWTFPALTTQGYSLATSFTVTVFTPCTNFSSVFRAKQRLASLTSHSANTYIYFINYTYIIIIMQYNYNHNNYY